MDSQHDKPIYNWSDPTLLDAHWENPALRDLLNSIESLRIDQRDPGCPTTSHFHYVHDATGQEVETQIIHFDESFIYLRSPRPVEPGTILIVDKEKIAAHVLEHAPPHFRARVIEMHHGRRPGETRASIFILKVRPELISTDSKI